MSFEEWWKEVEKEDKPDEYHDTNAYFYAKHAWDAAIDEAVKVVDNSVSKSCVGIVVKLRELK